MIHPRLLIVGTTPYSTKDQSRAFDAFFHYWEKENIAQIFCKPQSPVKGHCGTRLLDDPLPKGVLIGKALNYLNNVWTAVMAYRYDGQYCIDNSIAERSIRPLTIECKNKMAFGSHEGVETSTVYHTFIATCKMNALSFRQFLKNYLTIYMDGRTDFENMTPDIPSKAC